MSVSTTYLLKCYFTDYIRINIHAIYKFTLFVVMQTNLS